MTYSVFNMLLNATVPCLYLDPMTFIYDLDLHILKMHLHTKSEVSRSRLSTSDWANRQTDARGRSHYEATFVSGS